MGGTQPAAARGGFACLLTAVMQLHGDCELSTLYAEMAAKRRLQGSFRARCVSVVHIKQAVYAWLLCELMQGHLAVLRSPHLGRSSNRSSASAPEALVHSTSIEDAGLCCAAQAGREPTLHSGQLLRTAAGTRPFVDAVT